MPEKLGRARGPCVPAPFLEHGSARQGERAEAGGFQVVVEDAGHAMAHHVARAGDGVGRDRNAEAMASSNTMPKVSVRLGNTNTSAPA